MCIYQASESNSIEREACVSNVQIGVIHVLDTQYDCTHRTYE